MGKTDIEATVWDENSEIQPEGGLSDEDIFGLGEFRDDSLEILFAEESDKGSESGKDETDTGTDGAEASSPTTEKDEPAAEKPDEQEEAPTPEIDTGLPKKLTFTAKIDRKEQSIELNESELPSIYQKAHNYERLTEKYEKVRAQNRAFMELSAQLGYASVEEMIEQASKADRESKVEALVSGGTSKEIAEDYIDRKISSAKESAKSGNDEDEEYDEQVQPEKPTDKAQSDTDYFREQVADFFKARPDLRGKIKTLPKEVSEALILRKGSLRELYAEWEAKQKTADMERIRKEKDLFAQRAEAATRAPVRGAPDSHTEKADKPDILRDAFRGDMDW